jgi:hypothetical protein
MAEKQIKRERMNALWDSGKSIDVTKIVLVIFTIRNNI